MYLDEANKKIIAALLGIGINFEIEEVDPAYNNLVRGTISSTGLNGVISAVQFKKIPDIVRSSLPNYIPVADTYNYQLSYSIQVSADWCKCKDDKYFAEAFYKKDFTCECQISKHHYHCPVCGKVVQIG